MKLLYSQEQLHLQICMQKHNDAITSGHSSLEKYTSHFIERAVCEKWVGDRTKSATYWPSPNSSGYHNLSFPFSWAAQPRTWGPSLCWDMVLIPASFLQLVWPSCRRGYIIIQILPASVTIHTQFNPWTVKVTSWYLRLGAPVIYKGAFLLLTAWPGSVCNKMNASLTGIKKFRKWFW